MKQELREIIENIHRLPWDHGLYTVPGKLTLTTKAAVIEDDGENDFFEELYYYLSIQDIQSITTNLRAQKNNPSTDEIVTAIEHYYKKPIRKEITENMNMLLRLNNGRINHSF